MENEATLLLKRLLTIISAKLATMSDTQSGTLMDSPVFKDLVMGPPRVQYTLFLTKGHDT